MKTISNIFTKIGEDLKMDSQSNNLLAAKNPLCNWIVYSYRLITTGTAATENSMLPYQNY